ncbi:choline transport protein [Aspergillus udagawae]|uniref:Choline transport protein n=1 Tax=Aspergillus udagawae TaxID=91492 RepID=A0A8H3NPH9_9EURO|nr:choline transport protein [Aspergillus udagawae]GFF37436.1 choline transport protein [Aspergillus udagawae]GFF98383.1 choline transport protein [Aspergillus udagawae]GFG10859.1 choline transport protein [Aspergillus udagawae]
MAPQDTHFGESKAECRVQDDVAQEAGYPGKGLVAPKYMGTVADQRDMSALGRVQVLRRNFHFISILGFGCTLISTWEVILTLLSSALTDGGTAGLIWGFLIVTAGFTLVFASIAEMASMAPTSGGQYHWVSEFAPRTGQKFLSYITGWLTATGWQCAIVSIAFLAGTIIQGLVVLNDPTYEFQRWHGTLLVVAITTFSILFNTFLAKNLPMVEGLILIVHVVGVFAIIIPLWVLAPRNSAKAVFTEFNNAGGWNSDGTATLVGLSTTITSMIGYDCSVHMSEEIKDAAETLPKAMMSAVAVNGVLGFVMIVSLCFTLGDVDSILSTPTGFPFIQIFYNTTNNYAATNTMTAVLVITLTASTITEVATASRQLWSFARDQGLPFSSFFAYVSLTPPGSAQGSSSVTDRSMQVTPGWNIPLNSVMVSLAVTILLSLINIGSQVALSAIVSLTITSLISAYILSIGCLLLKRIRGEGLPPRRWTLGRFGMAVNIAALAFLIPIFVFSFFPLTKTVDTKTMNWSVVMYLGMLAFASVYYVLWGRHNFIAPVALVKREGRYCA